MAALRRISVDLCSPAAPEIPSQLIVKWLYLLMQLVFSSNLGTVNQLNCQYFRQNSASRPTALLIVRRFSVTCQFQCGLNWLFNGLQTDDWYGNRSTASTYSVLVVYKYSHCHTYGFNFGGKSTSCLDLIVQLYNPYPD